MISRDYLLRQIQQLIQLLAQVLLKRQEGRQDEARILLEQTLERLPGFSGVRKELRREDVEALALTGDTVSAEKAVALADLLAVYGELLLEKGQDDEAATAFRHAEWLYSLTLAQERASVPLDIFDRIARAKAHADRLSG
jgi:hypothetical protein